MRRFRSALAVALCCFALAELFAESVWIAGKGGIYRSELDGETGALTTPELKLSYESGSFLAIHPSLNVIYSSYSEGKQGGYASLVPSDASDGLELQSVQLLKPEARTASHLAVSSNGNLLAGAHYGSESAFVSELEEDGTISGRRVRLSQEGSGPIKSQEQSRPHWVQFTQNDSQLQVVDLGADRIWTYRVGASLADIVLEREVALPIGTGPRHMSISEENGLAFVSGELSLDVVTLRYDPESGKLDPAHYMPAIPERGIPGQLALSEIQVHPNGNFLYVAVRGQDLIVVYQIDHDKGDISLVERQDATVEWPRHFTISQDGKWLIVAGRRSDELATFWINPFNGALEPSGSKVSVPEPVCVRAWGRL
ncbi:lactonase family protein [Pelagicoccus albus]|uniref:Lactonase family protein n=1 Tax=Pelagicoccus albus TaxID=415222 RepID=A0A7X1B469_9BACT|nr:lactonase family protein [Pelagicoccus albus]MBC2605354.1 lactonase family protein [Pelagicoccus albus]